MIQICRTYFRDEMIQLHQANELSDDELIDLKGFVNTILTHITNGNKNEERLVDLMGGMVIETESDKIKIRTIIEMGREVGLADSEIINKQQDKIIGLPLSSAKSYLEQYGKQTR